MSEKDLRVAKVILTAVHAGDIYPGAAAPILSAVTDGIFSLAEADAMLSLVDTGCATTDEVLADIEEWVCGMKGKVYSR